MDSNVFYVFGKAVSCMVSVFIIFQFFSKRYEKKIRYRWIYCISMFTIYFFVLGTNIVNNPVTNIGAWLIVVTVLGRVFFYNKQIKKRIYYTVNIVFLLVISICESLGTVLIGHIIDRITRNQEMLILDFIKTICGSVFAILFYYIIINRLFVKERTDIIPFKTYVLYGIITFFCLVNLGGMLVISKHEINARSYLNLIITTLLVVSMNLFLFYFLNVLPVNKELNHKLAFYEMQTKQKQQDYPYQKDYYLSLMGIFHDFNKHINVLNKLYKKGEISAAIKYTKSYEKTALELLENKYSSNVILNIIVNEKVALCKEKEIDFRINIQEVLMEFMEPMDITTIFGNILDNALEACESATQKEIELLIYPFNDIIMVTLTNSYGNNINWNSKEMPITNKGKGHGIGLKNVKKVLSKYNGSITCFVDEEKFNVEIMFS